jgi:hypothetical protein
MTFNKTISTELRDILKACTNKQERLRVAEKTGVSIHTLNSVIEGKRKITENNKPCIIDLLCISIKKAKDMRLSLLDYYQGLVNA